MTKFKDFVRKTGNGIVGTRAFPNGVWERGEFPSALDVRGVKFVGRIVPARQFVATDQIQNNERDESEHHVPEGMPRFHIPGEPQCHDVKDVGRGARRVQKRGHGRCRAVPWYKGKTQPAGERNNGENDYLQEFDKFPVARRSHKQHCSRDCSAKINAAPNRQADEKPWRRSFPSPFFRFGFHGWPWRYSVLAALKKAGNGIARTRAFPNGVWERGKPEMHSFR